MKNFNDTIRTILFVVIAFIAYHFLSPLIKDGASSTQVKDVDTKVESLDKKFEAEIQKVKDTQKKSIENQKTIIDNVEYIKNGQEVIYQHISIENGKKVKKNGFKKKYNELF